MPAALAHRGACARIRRAHERGPAGGLFGDLLHNLPAWLVSLVFHTVAILLLGLWMIEPPEQSLGIFLSTALSYQDLPGETGDPENPADEAFEFDDAGATDYQSVMADMLGANDELAELAKMDVDVPDSIGRMPSLEAEDMAKLPPAAGGGNALRPRPGASGESAPARRRDVVHRGGGCAGASSGLPGTKTRTAVGASTPSTEPPNAMADATAAAAYTATRPGRRWRCCRCSERARPTSKANTPPPSSTACGGSPTSRAATATSAARAAGGCTPMDWPRSSCAKRMA